MSVSSNFEVMGDKRLVGLKSGTLDPVSRGSSSVAATGSYSSGLRYHSLTNLPPSTRSRGPTLMGFVAATGLPHLASSQSFLASRGPVWTTSHLLDCKPSVLLASLNNHALHKTAPICPNGFCSGTHQDTENQSFRSMCSTIFSFIQSAVTAK